MPDANCEGCRSNVGCKFSLYNGAAECPCTRCVVKVMCNDPCDNLYVFATYVEEAMEKYVSNEVRR